MVSLRLIETSLTHPDVRTREYAQALLGVSNHRRSLVPLLEAAMRQIQIGVTLEDAAVAAWLIATPAPPPPPPAHRSRPHRQDEQPIQWPRYWVD